MADQQSALQGLTTDQVHKLSAQFGKNILIPEKKEHLFHKIAHILSEPMFLLLIAAATIYFFLGEPRDGAIMLVFVLAIISIDVIQEWKTDKTLKALKNLSAPHVKVIRNGKESIIQSVALVPGDVMVITEGVKIPADGTVITSSSLFVDESSLTGEAEGVWKIPTAQAEPGKDYWRKDYCYAGTLALQGSAHVVVDKIGASTEYGKIGLSVAAAPDEQTPLQKQTRSLISICAGIAAALFILVSTITFFNVAYLPFSERIVDSILSGITLSMSMIPEEFPVIMTVFLSMGAWRLAKKHSLIRKLPSVETLGAISVLCVDKTGTITMNAMTVSETWAVDADDHNLAETMGLGCEIDAYDPMEKAMRAHCDELGITKNKLYDGELLCSYAFSNESKVMGRVWKRGTIIKVAAKGSPESILALCAMSDSQLSAAQDKLKEMAAQGLRVIAIASSALRDAQSIPEKLSDCPLELRGLVGLSDPPRPSVKADIRECVEAGIRVVMITGDSGLTASSIAGKIGMPFPDHVITGDELNRMSDAELRQRVKDVSIFARVMPEHKMRIVKAFKKNGEIVAMTGDGVNDAPALKYADIGIAMGKRGSDVSREAADLVLLDDNFSTIVNTIRDGRRMYDNIRKAFGYTFTIHIPIAFASLLAPLLGIAPASLMILPLHIVLLELVIDPTCSIIFERQPAEIDIMRRAPRKPDEKILTPGILTKAIFQGLVIFAAAFGTYYIYLHYNPNNAPLARSMSLSIVFFANLFLVQVNSSSTTFVYTTFMRLINDKVMWAVNIGTVTGLIVILYTPINAYLKLAPLSFAQFATALAIAIVSVFWYEGVKLYNKLR